MLAIVTLVNRTEPISRRERPAKPALSRAAIVDAASIVLKRDGADKLTMRRVAAELDTGPASLYVYVKNTAALHALLIDRLLGNLDLGWDETEPWRTRLHRVLSDYESLLVQYPDLARTALFVWPDGPHYLDLIELLLRLLQGAGANMHTAAWAVDLLLQHASSTAAEWAARASGTGQDIRDLTTTLESADLNRHPVLASMGPGPFTRGDPEERSRWAEDALIDGILSHQSQ
ncbi:MAG: TetR/AcrR family transcriptional regulator [Acidipropionibacterium jensenii]|nr:TetR/AcrR family transcriptional regulator [Acidipropionibacterium jensenii]